MENLAEKKCVPCRGGVPPLEHDVQEKLLLELNGWQIISYHHLSKEYKFKNFLEGLAFINNIGELAESEGHHPDLHLSYSSVKVEIWTHKIDGLTESDFILAAKIDRLLKK
jgi:4a-hydroxytetrahydrobiopterin dehydratase